MSLQNLHISNIKNEQKSKNPIIGMDYPDVDVIRVGDTYYMVSTTMHFMPGGEILRSYDLVNWEHISYVYDRLDSTEGQKLRRDKNIYGMGMWAPSLRYHKGWFYVCFAANDTQRTYLYAAQNIEGPWEKKQIKGFYHDCSLLFDDDRAYIVYGNKHIYLSELNADLSGLKEGGLNRMVVSDTGHPGLGYEGAHAYKIHGKYYLFFIHSLRERWRRVQACFMADSLEGEFRGGDILNDDLGYCDQGVAQGGIVDTPEGKWYAMLFQDRGAVGRIPVLLPLAWKDDFPVLGKDGKVPENLTVKSTRPKHVYVSLTQSDDFRGESGFGEKDVNGKKVSGAGKRLYGSFGLKSAWQFNHEPELILTSLDKEKGCFKISCGKICRNVTQAVNTITQRMKYPGCAGEVTVDAGELKEGDYAGICALQGCYGLVAVTKREGRYFVVMKSREPDNSSLQGMKADDSEGLEWETQPLNCDVIRLKAEADFTNMGDEVKFYYQVNEEWIQIGPVHKLYFKMDHFTGCRFGLFVYATKELFGRAAFREFVYREK